MDPTAIPSVIVHARRHGWEPPSKPPRARTFRLRRGTAAALRKVAARVDAPERAATCKPAPAQ